jgi:hypothetical protein
LNSPKILLLNIWKTFVVYQSERIAPKKKKKVEVEVMTSSSRFFEVMRRLLIGCMEILFLILAAINIFGLY